MGEDSHHEFIHWLVDAVFLISNISYVDIFVR
jgi:hypothetical protein